jgi:very-short-patch-repair endonuclease
MNNQFLMICKTIGLSAPTPEHRFHPTRRWRIDFAWPNIKLAVELEGAVWTKGRHTRGYGFVGDMEKYNNLTEMGWHLLRYQPTKIDYDQIKRIYYDLIV